MSLVVLYLKWEHRAEKWEPVFGQSDAQTTTLSMDMHQRIEMNPDVMGGKPVIRGTRVPVETVLRKLGAGMPESEILADHPHLTLEDIRAAQAFAADYLAEEAVVHG